MKKVVALFLCFFLLVGFTIVPESGVEASSSSVQHVFSPKSYTHYGGTTYAVKKFTYPKTVKVRLSNGQYAYRSVKWSKVSFQKAYLNRTQRLVGTVHGTSKKAVWSVRIKNYPVRITTPVIRSVGKKQIPSMPKLLTAHFANGQRSTYKLTWGPRSTNTIGTKYVSYRASGLNVAFSGKVKLNVRDVMLTQPVFTILTNNEQIQAVGKIHYPEKGIRHYLIAENRETKKQYKKNIYPNRDGSYKVASLPLKPASYNVYVQSGVKRTSPVVVTLKGGQVPGDSESDIRNLLKGLLLNIQVTNPLLNDIVFPRIDGVTFSIDSNKSALSSAGKVTRGTNDELVTFTIQAKRGDITESITYNNILIPKRSQTDEEELDLWLNSIQIDNPLTKNIDLPTYPGVVFSIDSSNPAVVSSSGVVTRGDQDVYVNLTVRATKGSVTRTKSFPNILVPKKDASAESLIDDYLNRLVISSPVTTNITLPPLAGATVTLTSSNQAVITNGGVVTRGMTDQSVSLVVTVTKDGVTKTKIFLGLLVPKKEGGAEGEVDDYLAALSITSPLTANIVLPPFTGGTATLSSSNQAVVSNSGVVTRGTTDQTVSITVNATKDGVTKSRTFSNLLVPKDDALLTAELDAALNAINLGNLINLSTNISLPSASNGINVSWSSNQPGVISNTGVIQQDPTDAKSFILTASVTKNGLTRTKTFSGSVAANVQLVLADDVTKVKSSFGTLYPVFDLSLPTSLNGTPLTWTSSNPALMTSTGDVRENDVVTPFTLTVSNASTNQIINMSTQDVDTGLLGGLLDTLGAIVNPVVNALGGNSQSATLPSEYGGLLGIGAKSITNWESSHPDLVTIQGYNVTIKRDQQDHLVVLRAKYQGINQPIPIIVKLSKQ
ncbi:immunoglobulin-like domain-containing protein [Exiguobacterium profundum]|uniref:immunoglobulin-like domain-containing protein n=1 Tax=Exiguobacterium profundum TaxID=307643 RepID=UPI0029C47E27|nr:immunoglobulin-like domain-containing protein [Exiguobacterium profundum]MDX5980271.1 immunoglobulin-like domain-containing protein [Exiguobacterium profundum]